ncbi:bifunctional riboflavin kinase/FAD synthetase [Nodosilinea sp. LEGE 07088]|uniref:bifunctional riboflavin kinase/FAD synthetase n=1 Tax=Nodosilinea sp. LEGE 07088 TaxID=2777968 RepID=UPI0018826BE4|nr:bifunctional riboflavin kinase/FAD synthetase [Nodosilinea sp. LEGE 07088]MBE9136729.1 bifunctional riboflavin kinase/FAD synthetase [Nodosilinea sp. LEGE 07088]
MWITSSLTTAITPTAIALGNFDGVHLGHQAVIEPVAPAFGHGVEPVIEGASHGFGLQGFSDRQDRQPNLDRDGHQSVDPTAAPMPTVMTFFPHPQEFFSGRPRPLLTPLPEKATQISRLGIGQLLLLPFTQHLADLSPEAFVEQLLVQKLRVQYISVGKDFCFGKRRQGTVDDLKTLAQRHGVQVHIAPLTCLGTERISSSRIRQALETTDLSLVKQLLGRPYSLVGRVVRGQRLGHTLGFPTANLQLPNDKFLPPNGVYSVWVQGAIAAPYPLLPAVMNLGHRPTVNGVTLTAEVHLLNWTGDLYGKTLEVYLHGFLRPEQKFESLDGLKGQIQHDCQRALGELAQSPA